MKRKLTALILALALALSLAACGSGTTSAASGAASSEPAEQSAEQTDAANTLAKLDNTAWQYNADDDVYYQIGISYCATPADESYETLAVFVPGAYMTATDNGDNTFTCEFSNESVGKYTAATAPIVMPINTPGYSAQAALTEYTSVNEYTSAGFVYVHAGCRGRDAGAPAGVTDLKAAVRYLRYSANTLPGDTESIFTFGMSGGGAQSSLMGATGDSELYNAYLDQIGAVSGYSDAVKGSMCWCPITNLDTADEAYEWMLGTTRSGLTDEEQAISDALASAYAEYVNAAGFQSSDGTVLTLTESEEGIYQSGSYYDYMKGVIETSLNHFLSDTEFPYDASASSIGGGMGGHGFGDGERPDFANGEKPDGFDSGQLPDGSAPGEGQMPDGSAQGEGGTTEQNYEDTDDITRNETTSGVTVSGTYETAQDYIDALNANGEWVTYDADTNTATITSIADFVTALKSASKNLGAFDQLDGGQGENTLFGYGDGNGAHFDATLSNILSELGSDYASAYAEDLAKTDSAGNTAETRLKMYTPLYYLLQSEEGCGSSTVAKYWRIRTGINQGDCALSTEMNLALALEQYDGVESVDFETVWGLGHTQAERSGDSTSNFVEWVNECMSAE